MWGQPPYLMWGQPPSAVHRAKLDAFFLQSMKSNSFKDFTLMTKIQPTATTASSPDQSWVLNSLEPDQLANAKKHPIPRRHLKRPELLVLWALRLYLLFMMAVVGYQ